MDILEKIKKLQYERGWSTYQLALEAGLTQSTLTNMFTRKTMPSIATLTALCEAFDISLSQFFAEGDDIPTSQEEKELLKQYRKLDKKNKNIVKTLLNELV